MIKWPEPFRKQGQQLCNDGNTTVFFDAYNKDQLKQAVRDAYEDAAKACEKQDGVHDVIYADAISALIKEIPE